MPARAPGREVKRKMEYIRDEISEQIIGTAAALVREEGAHQVNVRKIIGRLGVTNRVFYNRFKNCDEVLRIVYARAVENMHQITEPEYHDRGSFIEACLTSGCEVLLQTYDVKMQFSRYVFEHDSLTEQNRLWWAERTKRVYRAALAQGYVKEIDVDAFCLAIWCMSRGFYADAAARGLTKEETLANFREGFRFLIESVAI